MSYNQTFYKITHGFGPEDYVEIDQSEVQKAFYCFLEKKDSVFSGGAIRGANILSIKPDFHRTMGWNRGHKMDVLDFEELQSKGIDRKLQNYLSESKEKVQYLIETNQTQLIGKNFEMPRISSPVSQEVQLLATKMKV